MHLVRRCSHDGPECTADSASTHSPIERALVDGTRLPSCSIRDVSRTPMRSIIVSLNQNGATIPSCVADRCREQPSPPCQLACIKSIGCTLARQSHPPVFHSDQFGTSLCCRRPSRVHRSTLPAVSLVSAVRHRTLTAYVSLTTTHQHAPAGWSVSVNGGHGSHASPIQLEP